MTHKTLAFNVCLKRTLVFIRQAIIYFIYYKNRTRSTHKKTLKQNIKQKMDQATETKSKICL